VNEKLTEQSAVTAPVVYIVPFHEPAEHVPPTVVLVVYPVFGVTVNDVVEPLVRPLRLAGDTVPPVPAVADTV
jgi:hypothetical protein